MRKRNQPHTEETKLKISKALTGRRLTKEHITKLVKAHIGIELSKEHKLKLSWAHFKRQGGEIRKETKDGYVLIFNPEHPNANSGNRIFEHRLVMEKKLGRYLESNEIVHHLNGIKNDNRPENLYLVRSAKEHSTKEVKQLTCPHCKNVINNIRI